MDHQWARCGWFLVYDVEPNNCWRCADVGGDHGEYRNLRFLASIMLVQENVDVTLEVPNAVSEHEHWTWPCARKKIQYICTIPGCLSQEVSIIFEFDTGCCSEPSIVFIFDALNEPGRVCIVLDRQKMRSHRMMAESSRPCSTLAY